MLLYFLQSFIALVYWEGHRLNSSLCSNVHSSFKKNISSSKISEKKLIDIMKLPTFVFIASIMLLGPTAGLMTPTFAASTMNADELRMVYDKGPTPATILVTDSAGTVHGTYDIPDNGQGTKFLVTPVSG